MTWPDAFAAAAFCACQAAIFIALFWSDRPRKGDADGKR